MHGLRWPGLHAAEIGRKWGLQDECDTHQQPCKPSSAFMTSTRDPALMTASAGDGLSGAAAAVCISPPDAACCFLWYAGRSCSGHLQGVCNITKSVHVEYMQQHNCCAIDTFSKLASRAQSTHLPIGAPHEAMQLIGQVSNLLPLQARRPGRGIDPSLRADPEFNQGNAGPLGRWIATKMRGCSG